MQLSLHDHTLAAFCRALHNHSLIPSEDWVSPPPPSISVGQRAALNATFGDQ